MAFKKPSGIALTQANFYVFVLINIGIVKQIIIAATSKLRRLISEEKYMKNYVDELKAGYIFNLQFLIDQSLSIFDCIHFYGRNKLYIYCPFNGIVLGLYIENSHMNNN
jgi:hypothetical protein